jgi:hypothetical protein
MYTPLEQEVLQVIAREQHQRLIDEAAFARRLRRLDKAAVTLEDRKEDSYLWKRRLVYSIAIGSSILLVSGIF